MKNVALLFGSLLLVLCADATAQKRVSIAYADEEIQIDGYLNESIWDKHEPADSFYQYFPVDTVQARDQTEIRMAYDAKYLYIGITCYSRHNDFVVPSLKRDFRAGGSDNITLLIDPKNDGNNAYMFGTNPLGVKREGLITRGGTALEGFSTSWDQTWFAESSIGPDYWVSELKIPFRILQFDQETRSWSFNVYRFDTYENERSTWVRIPQTQWIFNLRFMGEMFFERPLKAGTSRAVLIPYVTAGHFADNEAEDPVQTPRFNAGIDAKLNVGSDLKLDLTINPDFSQVEVDRQITNLDRFELFFPERRQFFLENNDLFSNFGFRNVNPFFSRRIGIVEDPETGFNVQNPIYGGARLSGFINDNWRIGLMSMQTAADSSLSVPSSNFTVASIQRNLFQRSNISFIFVNKQNTWGETETPDLELFNRVAGIDLNFATPSNNWYGKLFTHFSFDQVPTPRAFTTGLFVENINENLRLRWRHLYVGEGYRAATGFVPRNRFLQFTPSADYIFKSATSYVNQHGPGATLDVIWDPDGFVSDLLFSLEYKIRTIYNYTFDLGLNRQAIFLYEDFDPTGTDVLPLIGNTVYFFNYFTADLRSDRSRPFSYRFGTTFGGYYNGTRLALQGNVNYFRKPFLNLSINYTYNWFNLLHLPQNVHTFLIGPRLDLTFTKSLFFTSFVQYNTQSKNTNMNLRFQWRYAPVSDLFLVYTDNYFSDPTDPASRFIGDLRNRSIVLKASYWLGF